MNGETDLREFCRELLNGFATAEPYDLSGMLHRELARAAGAREPQEAWSPAAVPAPADAAQERLLLLALSPALLLEGVWLARVARPATAHRPAETCLFDLYCRLVGLADRTRSPPVLYRALLTAAGLDLPPLASPSFFRDSRLPGFALPMPAVHLSLMHRTRSFFPELLGYTLAHCSMDAGWWQRFRVFEGQPWAAGRGDVLKSARHRVMAAIETNPFEERVRSGWNLYRRLFESLAADSAAWIARKSAPGEAMAGMIRAKRPYAAGYHRRVMVQGRSLDDWLRDAGEDLSPLLQALRDSPYVDTDRPAESRLIRAMAFGGPMFGVFDGEERKLCQDWIGHAETAAVPPEAGREPRPEIRSTARCEAAPRQVPAETPTRRQLFTALLLAESPADLPTAAAKEIERVWRRTRWLNRLRRQDPRLRIYDPDGFRGYVDAIHRREIEHYRPLQGAPKVSEDVCRWAIVQLAPAILVDGCWLAGVATAAETLDEVGRHLLNIYADELGNGRCEWNHSNVYRRLLDSLNIELPPIASAAFAADPRFTGAAFDIPVYLLAMGRLGERYFPELLGLNLAIELNGLGAGYMSVIDILRHYRMDPTIIELHLAIDNLAAGHAARARDAIAIFLEAVRRREGAAAMQAVWARVRLGYRSLNTAALGLVGRFAARYCYGRLTAKLS
jgi:hypothetical protein